MKRTLIKLYKTTIQIVKLFTIIYPVIVGIYNYIKTDWYPKIKSIWEWPNSIK